MIVAALARPLLDFSPSIVLKFAHITYDLAGDLLFLL